MSQPAPIPGPSAPSALTVLQRLIPSATRVRAAVAFVTEPGVALVEDLLSQTEAPVELVARGAQITQPTAIERLESLGVAISLVVGANAAAFHPKLWLIESPGAMHVLSGSGNLTAGGLLKNNEQFELMAIPAADEELVNQHRTRFATLTAAAHPLPKLRSSSFWLEWNEQMPAREELRRRAAELDRRLQARLDAELGHARK